MALVQPRFELHDQKERSDNPPRDVRCNEGAFLPFQPQIRNAGLWEINRPLNGSDFLPPKRGIGSDRAPFKVTCNWRGLFPLEGSFFPSLYDC